MALPRLLSVPMLRAVARTRPSKIIAAGASACGGLLATACQCTSQQQSSDVPDDGVLREQQPGSAAAASARTPKPQWPEDSREKWAYPSPYHVADATVGHVGPGAFVALPEDRFLDPRKSWRLKALVDHWQTLEDSESWPWVWCQHNPNGPHHVFVGVDDTLLDRCKAITAASPRNNITVIVSSKEALSQHAPLSDYFGAGAAVIEGDVAQFDATDRVLMMGDERIICFDKCCVL
jgi:hypothetical protein